LELNLERERIRAKHAKHVKPRRRMRRPRRPRRSKENFREYIYIYIYIYQDRNSISEVLIRVPIGAPIGGPNGIPYGGRCVWTYTKHTHTQTCNESCSCMFRICCCIYYLSIPSILFSVTSPYIHIYIYVYISGANGCWSDICRDGVLYTRSPYVPLCSD